MRTELLSFPSSLSLSLFLYVPSGILSIYLSLSVSLRASGSKRSQRHFPHPGHFVDGAFKSVITFVRAILF